MTTREYRYEVDTNSDGQFFGDIFINGEKVIHQPHKPDTSSWSSLDEVSAWCKSHIEQLKSFDAKNEELEAQKLTDSQRLANLETMIAEIHAKLHE